MLVLTNESHPFFWKVFQMGIYFVVVFIYFHEFKVSERTEKEMKGDNDQEKNDHSLKAVLYVKNYKQLQIIQINP
jgi:hypothetical protein